MDVERGTNRVLAAREGFRRDGATVWLDHAAEDPKQRFKMFCYFRAKKGHFSPEHHFGFEAAAWYWHFVDVVWLFLFLAVYFWGNVIGTGH